MKAIIHGMIHTMTAVSYTHLRGRANPFPWGRFAEEKRKRDAQDQREQNRYDLSGAYVFAESGV